MSPRVQGQLAVFLLCWETMRKKRKRIGIGDLDFDSRVFSPFSVNDGNPDVGKAKRKKETGVGEAPIFIGIVSHFFSRFSIGSADEFY